MDSLNTVTGAQMGHALEEAQETLARVEAALHEGTPEALAALLDKEVPLTPELRGQIGALILALTSFDQRRDAILRGLTPLQSGVVDLPKGT
jgi:hypothetical protein